MVTGAPHTADMSLSFPLLGDRVLLRPFETADAPAAHAVYGDDEVMRFVGEGGAVSPEETVRMVGGYRRHQDEHGFAFWAVMARGTGELIGDAGLEVTEHGVELGYTLSRRWWGRGLATEAASLCMDVAFGPLALGQVVALVDVDNPASARVLEKLGFTNQGRTTSYGRLHHGFELGTYQPVTTGRSPFWSA